MCFRYTSKFARDLNTRKTLPDVKLAGLSISEVKSAVTIQIMSENALSLNTKHVFFGTRFSHRWYKIVSRVLKIFLWGCNIM